MSELDPEYPEILEEMAAHLTKFLTERGMDPKAAGEAAFSATEHVRANVGGRVVYIPFGVSYEAQKRWEEIWEKFNGGNVVQLAREYDCTEVHINRILRQMRERKRREVQGDMFLRRDAEKHSSKT
jgi:Mor family transcriptional regulator